MKKAQLDSTTTIDLTPQEWGCIREALKKLRQSIVFKDPWNKEDVKLVNQILDKTA